MTQQQHQIVIKHHASTLSVAAALLIDNPDHQDWAIKFHFAINAMQSAIEEYQSDILADIHRRDAADDERLQDRIEFHPDEELGICEAFEG